MGVIRDFNALNNNNNNDFDNHLIEDIVDNIIDNNFETEVNGESGVRSEGSVRFDRNRGNRLRRNPLRPEPMFRALGLRGKSHKKSRRYANANLLYQQMDCLSDEELNDISIYDFIPQTVSAFAQLLIQSQNKKTWNELINCTEDQQNLLLDQIDEQTRAHNESKLNDNAIDNRKTDLAFSADQCFKRIDSELKNMFKRKHIPLGVLASIEEEITDFFSAKPVAIYKSCLSSGFQRLLLHACCQYLDLKCLSFDSNGERWSRVKNKNSYFAQPSVMLAKYLEARYETS